MRFVDYSSDSLNCFVSETDAPVMGDGEILCKVSAFGINRADLLQKQGKYPPPDGASPILGMELSGTVIEVAELSLSHLVAQPVCAMVSGGAYAEYVTFPASHVIPVLGNMQLVDSAGVPEVFLTAYQSLFSVAHVKPGTKVLIHAGASGVGTAAIQLAKASSAMVACTASSEQKNAACQKLGADLTINYQTHDFAQVLKAEKFFPDIIIDVVGEGHIQKNLQIAAMDCTIVQLAMMGGRHVSKLDMARMLAKRIHWQASTLRNRSDDYKARLVHGFLQTFGEKLKSGEISAVIDKRISVMDINDAHDYMTQNKNIGKLVVTW